MIKRLLLISLLLLISGCTSEPQTEEEFIAAGMEAFTKQDYAQARNYLGTAIARKPSDREILFFLGMAYSRDYLYDSAYYYLQRLNILYPNDLEANREIYNLAVELQEWEGAMHALNVVIASSDDPSQYWQELSELNIRAKRYSNAFHYKKLLLESEPENATRYLELANVAIVIDSVDVAIDLINTAIEKFGEHQELLLNKALYLAAGKHFTQSEAILRQLVAKDTNSVPAQLNLAHTLASQDSKVKKREAYELYIRLKPQTGGDLSVDSMLTALREELNIE